MNYTKVITHSTLTERLSSIHPFKNIAPHYEESLFANYLAMSQAFPYLQAGSQKDIFLYHISNNIPITKEVEITTVVGNFLSWDETGGLAVTLRKKMSGISDILNTENNFHCNYLRSDLKSLFNREFLPEYSPITQQYLMNLYGGLSDIDHVSRCAMMVSFEIHANQMILALWDSVSELHPTVTKNNLKYFYGHVGGDDPAEAYHVQMTEKMIALIATTPEKIENFLHFFDKYYHLHMTWCNDIASGIYEK